MKTVALEFIDFLKLAFTPDQVRTMPEQNLEEYRRTFYFAYNAAWNRVGKMVAPGVPEFEAARIMSATSLELGQFFDAILRAASLNAGVSMATTEAAIKAIDRFKEGADKPKLTHNGWPTGADLPNTFPKHIDADGKAHY